MIPTANELRWSHIQWPQERAQGSIRPVSQPRSWFPYFQAQVGVSAADSELGANRVLYLLGPTQRFPPVSKTLHESPTPVTAEGAGAWPSAPPILASWKSGWHHTQLISKSSLASYLLGGSLGERRQFSRNAAQAHSPTVLWQQRLIALMEFALWYNISKLISQAVPSPNGRGTGEATLPSPEAG